MTDQTRITISDINVSGEDEGNVLTVTVDGNVTASGVSSGEAWPIGSIFISVVATNPNTLLGYGTWSAFGTGRVLIGIDGGDVDFDTIEETGGAKTHTLIEAEMPIHSHIESVKGSPSGGTTGVESDTSSSGTTASINATGDAGSGDAHDNVQPYIITHMWKRTA